MHSLFSRLVRADVASGSSKSKVDNGGLHSRCHLGRLQAGEEAGEETEQNLGRQPDRKGDEHTLALGLVLRHGLSLESVGIVHSTVHNLRTGKDPVHEAHLLRDGRDDEAEQRQQSPRLDLVLLVRLVRLLDQTIEEAGRGLGNFVLHVLHIVIERTESSAHRFISFSESKCIGDRYASEHQTGTKKCTFQTETPIHQPTNRPAEAYERKVSMIIYQKWGKRHVRVSQTIEQYKMNI